MIELPTIPSDIDLLKANVTSVLQKIAALLLDRIAAESLATLKSANELVVGGKHQRCQSARKICTPKHTRSGAVRMEALD
jgi:hypothetical protein